MDGAVFQVHFHALGDRAVLDRHPFELPPAEIGAARILHTYIDGRLVDQAA